MTQESAQPNSTASSRRAFLKSTSAATVAGTLLGGMKIARSAHVAGDDEIKVALIGCGGRGTGAASQALSTKGKVKLWAMADAFADNIERCFSSLQQGGAKDGGYSADQIDVPPERRFVGFNAYLDAIDSGVDLVILTTPPGFRPMHFESAVQAGKHIFTEKPVGVDGVGIRRFQEAAELSKEKGLCVGAGLQRHHQLHYVDTIKRLQDGAIGDILLTKVYWNGGLLWVRSRKPGQTEMEYQMRNWYYFNWLCGDHIVEQHVHNLDVSNWLKGGPPILARGMGGRQVRTDKESGEIFDHHAVEFIYDDGTTMMSQCRHMQGCWSQVDEFAVGTKGKAHIGDGKIDAGGQAWKYDGPNPNPYQQEHDDLFAAIRSGATDYNESDYVATSTMTAILGRLATYSGKEVTYDDAINSEIDLSPASYAFDATPPIVPDEKGRYPIVVPGQSRVV